MSQTILLVEDEPNDAFFFEHCVRKAGIAASVLVAKDGQEALTYLESADQFANSEQFPLPWLVVLDLKLPRATGFEVLEHIQQQPKLRNFIVLVLTSSSSEEDIGRAYELGAKGYLVKPADSRQLGQIVQAINDFWLTHNRPPPSELSRLPCASQGPDPGIGAESFLTAWSS
jgi:CheY-like chemotaxis protein